VRHSGLVSRWSSVQIQQSLRQPNRNQAYSASVVRCVPGALLMQCYVSGTPVGAGSNESIISVREWADRGLPGSVAGGLRSARPRERAARHVRTLRADRVPNMCRHQTAFLRGHVELLGYRVVDDLCRLVGACRPKYLSRLAFSSGLFPPGT
jgi:hypothetical protein